MKIAIYQFNPTVGDFGGNVTQIVNAAQKAYHAGAQMMLTPELALCGYMPRDLLLRGAFLNACDLALEKIGDALTGLGGFCLVLGHPLRKKDDLGRTHLYNAASVLTAGKRLATYCQQFFPTQQAVDKYRYFAAGQEPFIFEMQGVRYSILIGQDIDSDIPLQVVEQGAQVLLSLGTSAFYVNAQEEREKYVQELVARAEVAIICANAFGGQDDQVFDGSSFAVAPHGGVIARAESFVEELLFIDVPEAPQMIQGQIVHKLRDENTAIWHALVLGMKDYFAKNGFSDAVLGLSGGMDSALVLAIAVDALGADHVRAVMMPSPYTAEISLQDAREMAARLNVQCDEIAINPIFDTFKQALTPLFKGLPEDITEENIQARIRGTLLMAISNKTDALVLVTGNKSEFFTGYSTLYGDMAGGFAVIKDVLKTKVYELANWRNKHDPFGGGKKPIPERIITRPPSAELSPGQLDQDNLPDYAILDEIIRRFIDNNEDIETIIRSGIERRVVNKVTRLIKISEYKRQQAPIGINISRHSAFGGNWRYPITSKFKG